MLKQKKHKQAQMFAAHKGDTYCGRIQAVGPSVTQLVTTSQWRGVTCVKCLRKYRGTSPSILARKGWTKRRRAQSKQPVAVGDH